jgi:RNA polymerase sigma-70 factor (ECF subfamily)
MPGEPSELKARAEEILTGHSLMLRSYARHLAASPHDAEDIVQEVHLAVLTEPRALLAGADPGAYLRGMTRHLASRHARRFRRDPVLEAVMETAWEDPAPAYDQADREALRECLGRLTDRARNMLAWRYGEGLNSRQIAGRLGASAEAVRMTLVRARQALAKCLGGPAVPGEED